MVIIIALLVSTATPIEQPDLLDMVDLIEINHYYDPSGRLVFDQVIFYDWSYRDARFHVRAWRLLKKSWQIPRKDWVNNSYITTWKDGDHIRTVKSSLFRETWTQYDPELLERDFLPRERRRGLSKPKPKH